MGKIYFEAEDDSLKVINIDDILKAIMDDCNKRSECTGCKYLSGDTHRCKFRDIPSEWELKYGCF